MCCQNTRFACRTTRQATNGCCGCNTCGCCRCCGCGCGCGDSGQTVTIARADFEPFILVPTATFDDEDGCDTCSCRRW